MKAAQETRARTLAAQLAARANGNLVSKGAGSAVVTADHLLPLARQVARLEELDRRLEWLTARAEALTRPDPTSPGGSWGLTRLTAEMLTEIDQALEASSRNGAGQ